MIQCPKCGGHGWDIGMMRECENCGHRYSILIDCGLRTRAELETPQKEFEEATR